jgi:hypothetical protein
MMKKSRYSLILLAAAILVLPALQLRAQADPPPIPEPSNIMAGALLLVPLVATTVWALRKPRK